MPGQVPQDVPLDTRYAEHRRSSGTDFSPLEPLQYWADLQGSGVPPDQVRLLALGGGRITAAECVMALALGASVGVVQGDGSEVDRCLGEPPWSVHPRLQTLPAEAEVVARFLVL